MKKEAYTYQWAKALEQKINKSIAPNSVRLKPVSVRRADYDEPLVFDLFVNKRWAFGLKDIETLPLTKILDRLDVLDGLSGVHYNTKNVPNLTTDDVLEVTAIDASGEVVDMVFDLSKNNWAK